MKTFNSFSQLKVAKLLTGTTVSILEPARVEGKVIATGEGLHLLSGNVFSADFVDQEATTGRKVILLADGFAGNLTTSLNKYNKDNVGQWVPDERGLTSAVFYNGQLWFPVTEIPFAPNGYPANNWKISNDVLEITTGASEGEGVILFERYKGLSNPAFAPTSAHYLGDGVNKIFKAPADVVNPLLVQVYVGGLRQDEFTIKANSVILDSAAPEGISVDLYAFNSVVVENAVSQSYVDSRDLEKASEVNNLMTTRNSIEITEGLTVSNPLQLYTKDGVEYLPDATKIPFVIGKDTEGFVVNNSAESVAASINNLHTKRESIEWVAGLEVTNALQVYSHTDGERSYLPNPKLVPFTTGATFAEDVEAGRFEESSILTQMQQWRDVGDVRGWGAKGDGITDATATISKALSTGKSVYIPEGIYIVKGGILYTRPKQVLKGDGIGKTILKLQDNAGASRLTIIEMSADSQIVDIEIDGNYQNNIADIGEWKVHTDSPFAQGVYTGRYCTNGNVGIGANRASINNVYCHDTIRSNFVFTGSQISVGTIRAHNSACDHHLYFTGSKKVSIQSAYCSGETTSSSVAFSTPPRAVCEDTIINNIYLTDIKQSVFSLEIGDDYTPIYLNFRAWTGAEGVFNASINNLYIDDNLEPFNTKRILIERNWIVNFGAVTIRTANTGNKRVLDINNGRASINTLDIRLSGAGEAINLTDVISVTTDDSLAFKTGLNVDYAYIDVFDNLQTDMRLLVNSGADINFGVLAYRGRRCLFNRIAAASSDAKTHIGVLRIIGSYSTWMYATETIPFTAYYSDDSRSKGIITTSNPDLKNHSIMQMGFSVATSVYRINGNINGQEFMVIGDGLGTLQQSSLLKTTTGSDILTEAGRPYKFIWTNTENGGVSYQIG